VLDQKTCYAPVVVVLPAHIDLPGAEQACGELAAAFASGASVVIADFSSTTFCDCPSLRRLAKIRYRAIARGAELRFVIPPDGAVRRVAGVVNLDELLPVYASLGEAVAAGPVAGSSRPGPSRAAARTPLPADVTSLTRASHLHIARWQAWFGELRRYLGGSLPGPGLAATWDTLAALIDLHVSADEEICAPVIYGGQPQRRVQARTARDAREDIRELIGETRLQPPGAPRWFHLATATLSAWIRLCRDEERVISAGCWGSADPELVRRAARQWRAFREARIRDLYPGVPSQLATCQLRQTRPATPRLADPGFAALACTCQDCTSRLDQHFFTRLIATYR